MRLKIIKGVFIFFLLSISLRLFYWQVVKADELSVKAEGQHFVGNKILAKRGNVYFSDMSLLASSKPTFSLFANPKVLSKEQKAQISSELSKILISDDAFALKQKISEKLSQDLFRVPIKSELDFDTKTKIENLNLPSLWFEEGMNRFYPEGSSSAHILGFVGADAKGEDTGYFGLEGYYDGELKGIPGLITHEKDASGLPIFIGKFLGKDSKNGKDLRLNIEGTIQFIVEKHLKEGIEKYGAKAASAVVMDPSTGAILALAAYPNYDPAIFNEFPKEYHKNPVVADQYEPGSTFKVLVMAAALNEGLIKPDTKCDVCSAPLSLGGFLIRTWNNKYYPDTSMKDVIVHSDNSGILFVGKKLGLDAFYSYLENFGFGQSTNIDLQDEFSPDLRLKDSWREIDLATASFGQGIAVTPIEMVRAVSAIANGGNLMEPHMVKEIRDGDSVYEVKPKVIRKVLKDEATKQVKDMMVAAVSEGEAKVFAPKGFKISGKTGTAQIPVAGHYDPNKTIASFVGFAPADNPKFVMLVRYDQPTSSIFGSETAAPTFFAIAKELFTYFKVAPTE